MTRFPLPSRGEVIASVAIGVTFWALFILGMGASLLAMGDTQAANFFLVWWR